MKINRVPFSKLVLIVILGLAALLRLWKLGSIPPGLTPDEAALGYNAYSILKTGRDEYGQALPVIFKSFGDFKPGLYIYLTLPSVAILGLNEFAVRLPSALAGIFAVLLIYLIINRLNNSLLTPHRSQLGLIAAFLLAINPWHLQFSRGAWEANVSLALTLAGVYFFLKSLKNYKFIVPSSLAFALTLITYQGAKLSTAIVVIILFVIFWRDFLQSFKLHFGTVLGSVALATVISLPILTSFTVGQTGRLTVFSVFSYPRPSEYLQNFLDEGNEKIGSVDYYLLHSETLNFARGVMGRWFNHFSGRFLFFDGDYPNPQHSAPGSGMLLLFDIFLLPLGVIFLLKRRSKFTAYIFLWLFLSPLPAVLSRDQVHAIRALNMVIPLTLVSACGLVGFVEFVNKLKPRVVIFLCSLFFALCSSVYFLDAYFVHLPIHDSSRWGHDFKQIVEVVVPIQDKYNKVKVQQSFAQPYIYFLFYGSQINPQKYDPAKYQKQANLIESEYKGDVGYITKLDNIEFVSIDWSVNRGDHGSLIVADPIRIPDADSEDMNQFKKIADIKYLNGITAYKIIEIQ